MGLLGSRQKEDYTLENDLRRHAHPSAHVDEVGEEGR